MSKIVCAKNNTRNDDIRNNRHQSLSKILCFRPNDRVNIMVNDQYFVISSEIEGNVLSNVELHIDGKIDNYVEYIQEIIISYGSEGTKEVVNGKLLSLFLYLSNCRVYYASLKNRIITIVPLNIGFFLDKFPLKRNQKIKFDIKTSGSYKLLSIHAKLSYYQPLRRTLIGLDVICIRKELLYSKIIYNQHCELNTIPNDSFLLFFSGVDLKNLKKISIFLDGCRLCNCNSDDELKYTKLDDDGIIILMDHEEISHDLFRRRTLADTNMVEKYSIFIETIDEKLIDTDTNICVYSFHYFLHSFL